MFEREANDKIANLGSNGREKSLTGEMLWYNDVYLMK